MEMRMKQSRKRMMRKDKKEKNMKNQLALKSAWVRQTGAGHKKSGTSCQDALVCRETGHFAFYGIADGQSGKKKGAEGGNICLQRVCSYIEKKGILALSKYRYTDEIQYELIKEIRNAINWLSNESGEAENEFSSTLAVLAVDKRSGTYMTVHLGDGVIFGQPSDGGFCLVSPPENGITGQYTWLTTSEQALSHLRIGFGNAEYYRRIVICSDGADYFCLGKKIPGQAKKVLEAAETPEKAAEWANAQMSADDASCWIIDVQ